MTVCGIIGFTGIVDPRLCRITFAAEYYKLLIPSFLFGGALMVVIDIFCRLPIENSETLVGAVNGLFGSVFFLFILKKRDRYA